ncbi:hypothetical protein GOP47_0019491 [Adiantum capillus-veneris]|uniref:Uncharacterized protein n=1 Tax=Adiantum capillus-veneris TaxID=13818 RepID=A0A9D4Z9N6_ADICA|nr:hypothetical protein GOP47_0019491 [Adiantum capillus-veneris]
MSSEAADKVATQHDNEEKDAQMDNQENSEDAVEVPKIVEEQTIHESDVVDTTEANEESGGDEKPAEEGEETAAEEEQEEEKPRKLTLDDIKTAPMDFRFPTTNQARHCFTRYVEYHKCIRAKGEDNSDCEKYARYYRSLCPGEWIDKWNEQRENGTFPGPLEFCVSNLSGQQGRMMMCLSSRDIYWLHYGYSSLPCQKFMGSSTAFTKNRPSVYFSPADFVVKR